MRSSKQPVIADCAHRLIRSFACEFELLVGMRRRHVKLAGGMNENIPLEKFDAELFGRRADWWRHSCDNRRSRPRQTPDRRKQGVRSSAMELIVFGCSTNPSAELGADFCKLRGRVFRDNYVEGCKSRGGGERIAVERAADVDRPPVSGAIGNCQLQYVATPRDGSERQTAADNLAKRAQIRRDAKCFLRAAKRDPKPGNDLVEDQ